MPDVTLDAVTKFPDPADDTITTMTWAHTIGGGPFNMLICSVASKSNIDVSSIVWDDGGDNVALTDLFDGTNNQARLHIWYLIDPKVGTFNIKVTMSGAGAHSAGVISFKNVVQSAAAFTDGTTISTTSSVHDQAVANMTSKDFALSFGSMQGTTSPTPDSGTTEQWDMWNTGGGTSGRRFSSCYSKTGTGSVTLEMNGGSGPDHIGRAFRLNDDFPSGANRSVLFA